jgi:hypothetical protein
MEAAQYRRDFAAYNSKLELAHYEYRAGLDAELRIAPIYERYGELFTREAVESLRIAESNVPAHLETEKSGMRALLGAACIGFMDAQAKELTDECARRESTAYIEWEGETLPSFSVPKRLASESSSVRRRELFSRLVESISEGDDSRAARLESLHQSARVIGFASYRALFTHILGTDFEKLASRADAFLQRTESPYRNSLARVAARDLPDVAPGDLHQADYFFFQRISSLDQFFPARDVMTTYKSAMKGMGIRIEQQTNIHIDIELRPGKHPRASCLRINPPDDVRLITAPIGGAHDYMTLFHEAGHAQHLGWTSRELMTTHPEFIYSPDHATTEGFAFLLNHLFHDPRWLQEHRPGTSAEQAQLIVRDLALLTTHTIRRFCAKLRYDIALHDCTQVRSEGLAATYAALQTEATGFVRSPALYLSDVDDGFYSGSYLRAWAFEAGLREYLRTRYGYRWWASRKAGDELIDLWSTASRYSAEEIARLLGQGELDFDLLAEAWIASMN